MDEIKYVLKDNNNKKMKRECSVEIMLCVFDQNKFYNTMLWTPLRIYFHQTLVFSTPASHCPCSFFFYCLFYGVCMFAGFLYGLNVSFLLASLLFLMSVCCNLRIIYCQDYIYFEYMLWWLFQMVSKGSREIAYYR